MFRSRRRGIARRHKLVKSFKRSFDGCLLCGDLRGDELVKLLQGFVNLGGSSHGSLIHETVPSLRDLRQPLRVILLEPEKIG